MADSTRTAIGARVYFTSHSPNSRDVGIRAVTQVANTRRWAAEYPRYFLGVEFPRLQKLSIGMTHRDRAELHSFLKNRRLAGTIDSRINSIPLLAKLCRIGDGDGRLDDSTRPRTAFKKNPIHCASGAPLCRGFHAPGRPVKFPSCRHAFDSEDATSRLAR